MRITDLIIELITLTQTRDQSLMVPIDRIANTKYIDRIANMIVDH